MVQLVYNSGPHISIDEFLVPLKRCHSFRQCVPSKPTTHHQGARQHGMQRLATHTEVDAGEPSGGTAERSHEMQVLLDISKSPARSLGNFTMFY